MSTQDNREYNDQVQQVRKRQVQQAKANGTYGSWWTRWGKPCVLGFLAGAFARDLFN